MSNLQKLKSISKVTLVFVALLLLMAVWFASGAGFTSLRLNGIGEYRDAQIGGMTDSELKQHDPEHFEAWSEGKNQN